MCHRRRCWKRWSALGPGCVNTASVGSCREAKFGEWPLFIQARTKAVRPETAKFGRPDSVAHDRFGSKAAETLGRSRVRFHIDCGSYGRRPLRTVQCQFRTHARHGDRGDRTTTYLQSEDHRRHYESCQNSVRHAVQQRLGRHDAGRRRGDGELRMRPIGSRADTTRRSAARPPPCRRAGPVRNNASSPRADCPR